MLKDRSLVGWQNIVALLSGLDVRAGAGLSQESLLKNPTRPPQDTNALPSAFRWSAGGRSLQFPPTGMRRRYCALLLQNIRYEPGGLTTPSRASARVTHGLRPSVGWSACVGDGISTGSPSRDPMKRRRSRV